MTPGFVPTKPATSMHVAQLAAVSRSTVSAILNGHGERFTAETRERVLKAAEAIQYRPSAAGRSLVSGYSDTVVLLLPNATFGPHLQDSVDRIIEGLDRFIGNVVVRFAGADPERSLVSIESLRPVAVVNFGIPLSADDYSRLAQSQITILPTEKEATVFAASDGGVAAMQMEAISATIDRPIWYASIADSRMDPYGPNRLMAVEELCKERKLAKPRTVVVEPNGTPATRAVQEITRGGAPANVLCYNDEVALSLLAAARNLSVAVPQAMTVVGVDNIAAGRLWEPALTSIDTNIGDIADNITDQLKIILSGGERKEHRLRHEMRIVWGKTTVTAS